MKIKLKWKGKYENPDQLAVGSLPEDAVKFKEPNNTLKLNIVVALISIPVVALVLICLDIKFGGNMSFLDMIDIFGCLLAMLMVIPHELLHAISFPNGSEVDVWFSSKALMAFVHSTMPTSKKRFIFLSLFPNILFGFLPFIVWSLIPTDMLGLSKFLFSFSFLGLLFGCGDYMNAFNAAIQMPKGAITQISGFNSYWYKKGSKNG